MTNSADYNVWANKTLIEWLRLKPSEVLDMEIASSYSSILKTLNHIWAVQEFWHAVVEESELTSNRFNAEKIDTEEVLNGIISQSEAMAKYIATLSEEDLLAKVQVDTPWVKGEMPRYEFIQHGLNHSTYHRGQIITMGHHTGLHDAPTTDYNYYNMVAKMSISY